MNNETIGIVVPVYNTQNYVKECIDSILKQSYEDYKLILVDDGSYDNSLSVIKEIKDNRIIIININHAGVSHARNIGIDYCLNDSSIKYITFIDSDDTIENDYLECLYNTKIEYCVKTSCCFIRRYDDRQNIGTYNKRLFSKKEILYNYFEDKIFFESPCLKLMDKEIFSDLKFEEGKHFEDTYICYKIIEKNDSIAYIDYYGYNNREREGSAVRSEYSNYNYDKVAASFEIYKYYENTEFAKLAYNKYLGSLIYFILKTNSNKKSISKNVFALRELKNLINENGLKDMKIKFIPFIILTKIGLIDKISI